MALGDKLGPFLWQVPAMLTYDRSRFESFFQRLPRTERAAATLAAGHDGRFTTRVDEAAWTATAPGREDRPLRHAIEVRSASFDTEDFYSLCRAHDVALVVSDGAGEWPVIHEVTSDHVYVLLHGGGGTDRGPLARPAHRGRPHRTGS